MNERQMAEALAKEKPWAQGREEDIEDWLYNFDTNHRCLAMKILYNVEVYSTKHCQKWCQRLHHKLPEAVRESEDSFFAGLGMASESGSFVSYHYRTANRLKRARFLDFTEAADATILQRRGVKNIIFVDDLIGSGNQAIEFWKSLSSHLGQYIDNLNFYYSAFFARSNAKTEVEKQTRFKINVVKELDESCKAFGVGSSVFEECFRDTAKAVFEGYGKKLFEEYPLGFRDGQLLIVLEHNTPNNTLPVLWGDNNWFPLFTRHHKIQLPLLNLDSKVRPEIRKPSRLKATMLVQQANLTPGMAGRTASETAQVESEEYAITAEVVGIYGGAIIKSIGDKALIQFSTCKDALACGYDLQQRIKKRNAALIDPRLVFELRIGIDSGKAGMLSADDFAGSAAERTARICSACPPGDVYVTELALSEIDQGTGRTSVVGDFALDNAKGVIDRIHRLDEWRNPATHSRNPFIWRGGIRTREDFFNRDNELRVIRNIWKQKQHTQLVGSQRIGKTSLLRQVERLARTWEGSVAATAYVDSRSPRNFTLAGLLDNVGQQFNLPRTPRSLVEFYEAIESSLSSGNRLILLLDEFEDTFLRPTEFTSDFFATLRSCGLLGLSIITATRRPMNEITELSDTSSTFYNAFEQLAVKEFSKSAIEEYLKVDRDAMTPFTDEELTFIRRFAKDGHPLVLQIVGFHVLQARQMGESLAAVKRRAEDNVKAYLSDW